MKYLSITKPGIIFGNALTVCAGFFLASYSSSSFPLLFYTLTGMILVIACGCVLNNYIDKDIDRLMERTKNRVMASGKISGKAALTYASFLGVIGLALLFYKTNLLTTALAFLGLLFYIVIYSLHYKRKSTHGTLIGGIAGAIPPVVGYCAVTGTFDLGAMILFSLLFCWQMPHFYAIALYRIKDFQSANLPVLPTKKSLLYTKITMNLFIAGFIVSSALPTVFGYKGNLYLIGAILLGLFWQLLGLQGFFTEKNSLWARRMFLYSIFNISLLSLWMMV